MSLGSGWFPTQRCSFNVPVSAKAFFFLSISFMMTSFFFSRVYVELQPAKIQIKQISGGRGFCVQLIVCSPVCSLTVISRSSAERWCVLWD